MAGATVRPGTASCSAVPRLADVEEALKRVIDPELGANVVDLGLLYRLGFGPDNALVIDMTLTSATCPVTEIITEQIGTALHGIVNEWRLNWVWMPPWGPDRITDLGRDQMRALRFKTGPLSAGMRPGQTNSGP